MLPNEVRSFAVASSRDHYYQDADSLRGDPEKISSTSLTVPFTTAPQGSGVFSKASRRTPASNLS
jgi:hypothetical protein